MKRLPRLNRPARSIGLFVTLIVLIGADCLTPAPTEALTQLRYDQGCAGEDVTVPIKATVTRLSADDYRLDAMAYRLIDGIESKGPCDDVDGEFIDGQCYEVVTMMRQLSQAEIAQVDAVYASLEIISRLNPGGPADDCALKVFCSATTTVNEEQYLNSTNECRPFAEPALTTDSFASVLDLLTDLTDGE